MLDVENYGIYPEHFGIPAHNYIYMSIVYLISKQQTPTPLVIMEVLQDKKAKETLENIGGLDYLNILQNNYVNPDNLEMYCSKVKQSFIRRTIVDICDETKTNMYDDKSEVLNETELISIIEKRIIDLSVSTANDMEVYKMGTNTDKVLEERANEPNVVPGLETGWVKFDRYTNGGQPGDLTFVCARAKVGKSVTLTNWAKKFAIDDGLPILYIDTEMSAREQEDRLLAIISGIPHNEILNGMYVVDTENGKAKDKILKLRQARDKLKEGKYYHIHLPQFTLEKVMSLAKKFKLQYNIAALFFDYIKIPANQMSGLRSIQEWQMLGYFASGLKDIASLLKIPVYSACQENRSNPKGQDKNETNIAGSDRILQLATKLIFLYDKTDEQIAKENIINGNQKLYIAFQRNGLSNVEPINIMFHKHILRQEEI